MLTIRFVNGCLRALSLHFKRAAIQNNLCSKEVGELNVRRKAKRLARQTVSTPNK